MWTSALGNEWRLHEPYKPYKLLSIERVAEVLLWRNEKHTITIILALVVVTPIMVVLRCMKGMNI